MKILGSLVRIIFALAIFYVMGYYTMVLGFKRNPEYLIWKVPTNSEIIPAFVTPGDSIEIILYKFESSTGRYRIKDLKVDFLQITGRDGNAIRWRPPKIGTPKGNFDPNRDLPSQNLDYSLKTTASITFAIPDRDEFFESTMVIKVRGKIIYLTHNPGQAKNTIVEHPIDMLKTITIGSGLDQVRIEQAGEILEDLVYVSVVIILVGLIAFGFFY